MTIPTLLKGLQETHATEMTVDIFISFIHYNIPKLKDTKEKIKSTIQCVSVDSASLIIYPEIKATEVAFSALKRYLCSFFFRIDNETGRIQ